MLTGPLPPDAWDPYDLWMTPLGVLAKRAFYCGKMVGKLSCVALGLADWLSPCLARIALRSPKRQFPITIAQWILAQDTFDEPDRQLEALIAAAVSDRPQDDLSWGLGFPWMSKNGLYDEQTPFVTHTPYALEALLHLADHSPDSEVAGQAMAAFRRARPFFDRLRVMYEEDDRLALSYAPVDEPRIVVNANSYAAYSYGLFASRDADDEAARLRAGSLLRWVASEQGDDGRWYYYADRLPGNFIDTFHSCFVIKNLIKTAALLPEYESLVGPAIERGMAFIETVLYDPSTGLMKRFAERDLRDPYVWDLYDQAEYLGVLELLGRLDEASRFAATVRHHFERRGRWYSRVDILGRGWGQGFLRWGIVPFLYHERRLERAWQAQGLADRADLGGEA